MNPLDISYRLSHPRYYEPSWRAPADDAYLLVLKEVLRSPEWSIERRKEWLVATPPNPLAERNGFFIELSSIPEEAAALVRAVAGCCHNHSASFRLLCDAWHLKLANARCAEPINACCFIRIGPQPPSRAVAVMVALEHTLCDREWRGPRRLASRPHGNGVISYRYGWDEDLRLLGVDGIRAPVSGSARELALDPPNSENAVPEEISDPFASAEAVDAGDGVPVLAGRWQIDSVISSGTCGGVYAGHDRRDGLEVVIKEARPLTLHFAGTEFVESVDALQREYRTLRHLKDIEGVPTSQGIVEEWGHVFLVMRKIRGIGLRRYFALDENVFLPTLKPRSPQGSFLRKFARILRGLIRIVSAVHARDYLVNSLCAFNVMVDEECRPYVVDWKAATCRQESNALPAIPEWRLHPWLEPGQSTKPSPEADWRDLAVVALSMMVPPTEFITLNRLAVGATLEWLRRRGVHGAALTAIQRLDAGDWLGAEARLDTLAAVGSNDGASVLRGRADLASAELYDDVSRNALSATRSTEDASKRQADLLCDAIAEHLLASCDADRHDRLWPTHYLVYQSNPLAVAYGALGPAVFLYRHVGELPSRIRDWLFSHTVDAGDYAPGLWNGMAGIAWAFTELGHIEYAECVLDECYSSPLLQADATMFHGAAGWGLASLRLYMLTKRQRYLDAVDRACEEILKAAIQYKGGQVWTNASDGLVNYGYGFGATGIAYFLLLAADTINRPELAPIAERALRFDLNAVAESGVGLAWPEYENGIRHLSFWGHGSAGIGMATARFSKRKRGQEWLTWTKRIADSLRLTWTSCPAQLNGMAGIADFHLDAAQILPDPESEITAGALADAIGLFAVRCPEGGICFPGRWLTRLSTDFASGSSGIGLFLNRLSRSGSKFLVDP